MSPTASCDGCIWLDEVIDHGCIMVARCMKFHRKLNEWPVDDLRPNVAPLRATCKEVAPDDQAA